MSSFVKLSNVIIFLFLISSSIFINGCDNTTVDPTITGVTINGIVGDAKGGGIGGLTVIINGSTATTASDGSFAINNITTPYDVKIMQSGVSVPTGILYRDISSINPVLYAPGITSSINSSLLTVNTPGISAAQTAKVYFTDGLNIESIGTIASSSASTSFTVKWPGSSSITGKVIVLIYTKIGSEIVSYNYYGEKSGFVLSNGSPSTATFTSAELPAVSGDTIVSGTVTAPSGYSSVTSSLQLTFRLQGSNMNAESLVTFLGSNFSFRIPKALTSTFRTLINGSANGTSSGAQTTKSSQVAVGSTGNNLILDEVPSLTAPTTTTNIDTTTTFSFVPGTGSGVNLISYASTSANFYVFTNYSACTIPNFSAFGLGLGSSVSYQWNVQKLSGISNTNNMVSGIVLNNANLVGTANSEIRSFTTTP